MIDLKAVILRLLNGDEVVISDDAGNYFTVELAKIPQGVDFGGDSTLLIRADRLVG